MKFLMQEKLSDHKYKDNNGYLICTDAILARTGKQTYRKNEVFADSDDDSEIEVDRKYEEVFSPATLASFENKPVTWDHPDTDVNAENHNELAVGFVRDVREGSYNGEPVIMGTLVITDARAIEEIEDGEHTDLSCGYDCDIVDEEHPQQRNIRGNHVALCQQGRAGIAKIVDSVKDSGVVANIYNKANHLIETKRFSSRAQLDSYLDKYDVIDMTADNNQIYKNKNGELDTRNEWKIIINDSKVMDSTYEFDGNQFDIDELKEDAYRYNLVPYWAGYDKNYIVKGNRQDIIKLLREYNMDYEIKNIKDSIKDSKYEINLPTEVFESIKNYLKNYEIIRRSGKEVNFEYDTNEAGYNCESALSKARIQKLPEKFYEDLAPYLNDFKSVSDDGYKYVWITESKLNQIKQQVAESKYSRHISEQIKSQLKNGNKEILLNGYYSNKDIPVLKEACQKEGVKFREVYSIGRGYSKLIIDSLFKDDAEMEYITSHKEALKMYNELVNREDVDPKEAKSRVYKYFKETVNDDLIQSGSEEALRKNIETEIKAGKDPKQAAAIAYSVQRENDSKTSFEETIKILKEKLGKLPAGAMTKEHIVDVLTVYCDYSRNEAKDFANKLGVSGVRSLIKDSELKDDKVIEQDRDWIIKKEESRFGHEYIRVYYKGREVQEFDIDDYDDENDAENDARMWVHAEKYMRGQKDSVKDEAKYIVYAKETFTNINGQRLFQKRNGGPLYMYPADADKFTEEEAIKKEKANGKYTWVKEKVSDSLKRYEISYIKDGITYIDIIKAKSLEDAISKRRK